MMKRFTEALKKRKRILKTILIWAQHPMQQQTLMKAKLPARKERIDTLFYYMPATKTYFH
jgi:hypothetical protein